MRAKWLHRLRCLLYAYFTPCYCFSGEDQRYWTFGVCLWCYERGTRAGALRFNQVKQERWLNRTYSFCMREQINSWLSENHSCLFTIQIWAPAANANNAMRAAIVEIAILGFQHTCNSQRRLLCSSLLWMNNFTHVGLCNKRDSNSGPPVWQMPVFLYFN